MEALCDVDGWLSMTLGSTRAQNGLLISSDLKFYQRNSNRVSIIRDTDSSVPHYEGVISFQHT